MYGGGGPPQPVTFDQNNGPQSMMMPPPMIQAPIRLTIPLIGETGILTYPGQTVDIQQNDYSTPDVR